jgi:hypothetical protein
MMREALLRRLEAIEEARRLRHRAAMGIIHIVFDRLDGSEMEADYAEAPGFICYRRPDEALADFEARCDEELRIGKPQ